MDKTSWRHTALVAALIAAMVWLSGVAFRALEQGID
jgi:hypothetical protein